MIINFLRDIKKKFLKSIEKQSTRIEPQEADCSIQDSRMSGWFQEETNELFKGFLIKPEHSVVDVGCGDGGFISFCAQRGAEVTIVDIDPETVTRVEQNLKASNARAVHAYNSDGAPLPLLNESYDRVISTEVIEHVDNPKQFISELVRIGKPGALYLLSVPDRASEIIQKQVAPDLYFEKPNHIHIFSRDDFKNLVEESGLIIEKRSYYGFYWSIFWTFFWTCDHDLMAPKHDLLKSWSKTWHILMQMRDGEKIKNALDEAIPKSQVIIARKPH